MSTHTTVTILDDLDQTPGATTVSFAINGQTYEIDLNDKNQKALEDALDPFIAVARRAPRQTTTAKPTHGSAGVSRGPSLATTKGYQVEEIRAWAKAQGMDVSERGRVANAIVEKYDEAMTKPKATEKAAVTAPAKKVAAKKAPAKKTAAKKVAVKKVAQPELADA